MAEPVLSNCDDLTINQLDTIAPVLTALKIALCDGVTRDEDGALSIILRDHSTFSAHIKWRKSQSTANP